MPLLHINRQELAVTTYRLTKTTVNHFVREGEEVTCEILWVGSNLTELNDEYPRPMSHHDSLLFGGIEDGYVRWNSVFEKFEGGQWAECADPRTPQDLNEDNSYAGLPYCEIHDSDSHSMASCPMANAL